MDTEQQIIDITPNSKSWSCKIVIIEKLNERESINKPGLTYKPMILQDSVGHKVKAMTYGQDVAIIDKRIQLNDTYKVFDARVSPAKPGFGVPDESYKFIWTLNRRTMIHDVGSEEKIVHEPNAETNMEPFSMFYKSMSAKKEINVLGIVISKLARKFVFTSKRQETTTDLIIIDQECKPISLTLWDKFAINQGSDIEKALDSGCYPTILAKRILATSYQGLSLTTRQDSAIELNPAIPLAACLEEWKGSNALTIEDALERKQYEDPLSVFVSPEDIEVISISDLKRTTNQEQMHWVEGDLQLLENEPITLYIACNTCNRKVHSREGISYKCMRCGDEEAVTAKRVAAEISDGRDVIQVTLFTKELNKILKTLEWNTTLDTIETLNLNKDLQSLTILAAIRESSASYETHTSNMYSIQSLYSISQKKNSTSTLKRKMKVEEDVNKKRHRKCFKQWKGFRTMCLLLASL